MKQNPSLAIVDRDFLHLFGSWFNRGFLVLAPHRLVLAGGAS